MRRTAVFFLQMTLVVGFGPALAFAAEEPLPTYLQDRGVGIPTSQFGTYIERGQWIVYPFYEYSKNSDEEYDPREFGFPRPGVVGEEEFFGESSEHEAVLFRAYGFSDKLAFEFEAEFYASATLDKAALDMSPLPARTKESGFVRGFK